MTTTIQGLLIEPDRMPKSVELPSGGCAKELYELLGCRTFEVLHGGTFSAYCDEESQFAGKPGNAFASVIFGQYVSGAVILLGNPDERGNDTSLNPNVRANFMGYIGPIMDMRPTPDTTTEARIEALITEYDNRGEGASTLTALDMLSELMDLLR